MSNYRNIIYQKDDLQIEVKKEDGSYRFFLSNDQIANLFQKDKSNMNKCIKKLFTQGILNKNSVSVKFTTTARDGKNYEVEFYSLDVVLELDRILKSNEGIKLKQYLEENYSQNYEIEPLKDEEVIIYNNGDISIDVRVSPEEETVWLSQDEICILFDISQSTVSEHINNILSGASFEENRTYRNFRYVAPKVQYLKELKVNKIEGKRIVNRTVTYYNLDMILAIGYRVKTTKASIFRSWVSNILSPYLLKGYVINPKRVLSHPESLQSISKKLDSLQVGINQLLENKDDETLIEKGQYFDAYLKIVDIFQSANKEIIIVERYFDDEGLKLLSKSKPNIIRKVFLSKPNQLSNEAIEAFEKQHGNISIYKMRTFHDRFIIIDKEKCYSIGSSLNSLADATSLTIKVRSKRTLERLLSIIDSLEN